MFKKFYFTLAFQAMVAAGYTQDSAIATIDTAAILKDLQSLLAMEPVSYVNIELSAGNRLFSQRNNRLNARQQDQNLLVFSPNVSYHHKSGLSANAGFNMVQESGNTYPIAQYNAGLSYTYSRHKYFGASISYDHYFVKDIFSAYSSPVQNDWYLSADYSKWRVTPSLAIGYATGKYGIERIKDTIINGIRRRLYDSATNHIKTFSMIIAASHEWSWEAVLSKEDALSFSPAVMLNIGSSNTTITRKTNAQQLLNLISRRRPLPKFEQTAFRAESVGLNLDLTYDIGNFYLNPQYYMDYYLPATTENRFTGLFSFTLGYSF
jgi:hypothetical protein